MTWLALDPSFRNTGWAIMDENEVYDLGLIQTAKGDGPVYLDTMRCAEALCYRIGETMDKLKEQYFGLKVYSEAKGGSKSAKAATMMAMSQAIVSCCSLYEGMDLTLMLPQKVKQIVCGSRSASKDDITNAVSRKYPGAMQLMERSGLTTKAKREHVWDALAIGWAINEERKRI